MKKKRIEYTKGEEIGEAVFLKDAPPRYRGKEKIRRALFLCSCGNEFEADVRNVKCGNTKSCGCLHRRQLIERNIEYGKSGVLIKHGLSYDKIHQTWMDIKRRCYNKNCPSYKNYGGRGIRVHEPWIKDFKDWYDYVSALPYFGEKGRSIDRINNNGNYEPGNLRWATPQEQVLNRRVQRNNSTGYTGVSYYKDKGMYMSYIVIKRKMKNLGLFNTKDEAIYARNSFIANNNLPHKIQAYEQSLNK